MWDQHSEVFLYAQPETVSVISQCTRRKAEMLLVISYSPHIKLLLMCLDMKTFLYVFKQAIFYNNNGKVRLPLLHLYFPSFLSIRAPQNVASGPASLAWPENLQECMFSGLAPE